MLYFSIYSEEYIKNLKHDKETLFLNIISKKIILTKDVINH